MERNLVMNILMADEKNGYKKGFVVVVIRSEMN